MANPEIPIPGITRAVTTRPSTEPVRRRAPSGTPTGEPTPPKKGHPVRNTLLTLGAVATGVGTWLGVGTRGGSEEPVTSTTLPPASATTGPESPTTVVPTTETTVQPESGELQRRFDAFFNMTDEEFKEYAETNFFRLGSGLGNWNFPDWVTTDNNSRVTGYTNPDRFTYEKDGRSNTIELSPHYSVVSINERNATNGSPESLRSWKILGFNLGIQHVPIQSGDYSSADVMYLGMVFPDNLGGDKVIIPITISAETRDPNDPRSEKFVSTPFVRAMSVDHSLHDGDAPSYEPTPAADVIASLQDNIGKPVMINLFNEGSLAAQNQIEGIDDFVPDSSGFLHSFEELFLGNTAGFQSTLEAASANGYIMTATHPESLNHIGQGFADINDAMRKAPVGATTIMRTPSPLPSLK